MKKKDTEQKERHKTMTRKDYNLIADVLQRELPFTCKLSDVAYKLAEAFAQANPKFNREKFLAKALEGL